MAYKDEAARLKKIGAKAYAAEQKSKAAASTKAKPTPEKVQNINPKDEESQAKIKQIREQPQNINPITKTLSSRIDDPQSFGDKALKVAASPKTTLALGGTLAALTGVGLATGALGGAAATTAVGSEVAGSTATITRMATSLTKAPITVTTQRAFVGKAATSGIDKIFNTIRPIATRFATNSKSATLTASWLTKLGKSLVSPTGIMAIIGTYPFAGFIKEEALQTISFASKSAIANGDVEGANAAIAEQEQLLNPDLWNNILNAIPFSNVLNQLKSFYKTASIKLDNDKKTVELLNQGNGQTLWQTQQEEQSKIGITEDNE